MPDETHAIQLTLSGPEAAALFNMASVGCTLAVAGKAIRSDVLLARESLSQLGVENWTALLERVQKLVNAGLPGYAGDLEPL